MCLLPIYSGHLPLADVYVFPNFVDREDTILSAIDIPLSVPGAMSCNLPVITTRFGGLDRLLEDRSGLFFVEDANKTVDAQGDLS
jgi:hypothetical protein